jgi:hypothetical protein
MIHDNKGPEPLQIAEILFVTANWAKMLMTVKISIWAPILSILTLAVIGYINWKKRLWISFFCLSLPQFFVSIWWLYLWWGMR